MIHGDWGSGKSWFAQTAPTPRLVLDAEGGAEYTFGSKVIWDNPNLEPPAYDGTWETCILHVPNRNTLTKAYQWLRRGQHPFESVILDSLSELQKRIVDEVAGDNQLQIQDWGEVFRKGEALVRSFRDLKNNPVKPVSCVAYVAGTIDRGKKDDVKMKPYVQGQLGHTLPGFVDIVGMIEVDELDQHVLRVRPTTGATVKDRTHVFRDGTVDITYVDGEGWRNTIESMMRQITEALATRGRREGDS